MFTILSFVSMEEFWENLKLMKLVPTLCIIAAVAVVLIVMAIVNKKTGGLKWDTRKLTYGAVCVALAYVLSFVKLFELPRGGSITAASMLPILAYGYMAGPVYGTAVGIVYFLLQLTQGLYFLSPLQFAFDYIFPFVALGTLSGVFRTKNENVNLYLGFFLAVVARYAFHVIAGIVFWGEYATFQPVYLYSMAYNSFVLIDAISCFVLISIPALKKLFKPMRKAK